MRQSKRCFRCNKRKAINLFYVHLQMADRHLNKCIDCTKIDTEQRRAFLEKTNPEWAEKEKQRHREKAMRQYFREKGTEEFKEKRKRQGAARIKKYPERARAVWAANNALRDGRIERKTKCERCRVSGVRLEKHHADYSKPLEVEWLCRKCHINETWYKK